MNRKQWLETFIELADSGAPALQYRRKLGLKTNVLGTHVKQLGLYRDELNNICEQEEKAKKMEAECERKERDRDAARKRELESRLRKQKDKSERLDSQNRDRQGNDSKSARKKDSRRDVSPDNEEASSGQKSDSEDV